MIDTPYGRLPGCPDCDVIHFGGEPHLCEHGVTPGMKLELSGTLELSEVDYDRIKGAFGGMCDQ
jgi:hypothetical protein